MPSTNGGQPGASGLRQRPIIRLAALALVLGAAFLATRSCASSGTTYSQKQAIAIARKQLDFTPKCVQVRYLREGFHSNPVWAVSLWTLDAKGEFDRLTTVQVSAQTGKVLTVRRQPPTQSTPPQCSSPV